MLKVLTFLFVALALLTASADAYACSCRFTTPEENLKTADAVFWGKVTKVEFDRGRRIATFDVGKWFKGGKQKQLKVSTNQGGTACGVSFAQGESYRVFAYERNGEYATSSCSSTQQMRVRATSATKPAPKRDLTKQKRALDAVLRPLARKAVEPCGNGAQFILTIYDNGEYDIDRESECWDKHFAPKFKVPKLPRGYPFTISVWLRTKEISLDYKDDGRAPLLRGGMADALGARIPPGGRDAQLLMYQVRALDKWFSRDEVELACALSGEAAALRLLKARAKKDRAAEYLLEEVDEILYRCAVGRQDWKRAAELVGKVEDYSAGPVERKVRAETANLKDRPKLSNLSVSPQELLRLGRRSYRWTADIVLLQLMAQALLAQPNPSSADRMLAARAYARASQLMHPPDPELRKLAIGLGGEAVVDEMEAAARTDQFMERANRQLEKAKEQGKPIPTLPK